MHILTKRGLTDVKQIERSASNIIDQNNTLIDAISPLYTNYIPHHVYPQPTLSTLSENIPISSYNNLYPLDILLQYRWYTHTHHHRFIMVGTLYS